MIHTFVAWAGVAQTIEKWSCGVRDCPQSSGIKTMDLKIVTVSNVTVKINPSIPPDDSYLGRSLLWA